jgi:hypothetical protein
MPGKHGKEDRRLLSFANIAMICDSLVTEALLLNFIFVSETVLKQCGWEPNPEHLPHNIDVKRMPKACNNGTQRCLIIRTLGFTLAPYPAECKPSGAFGNAPLHLQLHLHWSVLAEVSAPSCGYVVIPAHAAWLSQPLNTHACFRYGYGIFAKRRSAETALNASTENKTQTMKRLVVDAVARVLEGLRWQRASGRRTSGQSFLTSLRLWLGDSTTTVTRQPFQTSGPIWSRSTAASYASVRSMRIL